MMKLACHLCRKSQTLELHPALEQNIGMMYAVIGDQALPKVVCEECKTRSMKPIPVEA